MDLSPGWDKLSTNFCWKATKCSVCSWKRVLCTLESTISGLQECLQSWPTKSHSLKPINKTRCRPWLSSIMSEWSTTKDWRKCTIRFPMARASRSFLYSIYCTRDPIGISWRLLTNIPLCKTLGTDTSLPCFVQLTHFKYFQGNKRFLVLN